MARTSRASRQRPQRFRDHLIRQTAVGLLLALGVALALLPSSATAANGGAAPVAVSSGSGGGAAPGVEPPSGSAARPSGGAVPGHKPLQVVKPKAPARPAPPSAPPSAPAPTPAPLPAPTVPTVAGQFPVQGTYTFGGKDARFGVGRPGHTHEGQDVAAASGTPIVAPVAGVVSYKANQPGGAGIYLVIRATADGRDYVFMHLKRGSLLVAPGDPVMAGQALAEVGSTGSSTGPHLHLEIWIGGWQARGGAPIDPLPQLERWAGS